MKAKTAALFAATLLITLFAGCKSAPPVIPDNLSQPEFFQKAQEEADGYRWDNALLYYRTFLERYPDDFVNVMAARYEVAFILYKKQEYRESRKLFEDLLKTFKELPNPLAVPQWPKVLAEKLLVKIDEKLAALLPTKSEPKPADDKNLPGAPTNTLK